MDCQRDAGLAGFSADCQNHGNSASGGNPAAAASRVYASLLFGMQAADAASCLPAVQAAGIDPLVSLRAE
ncbi:MAG TPA: hypothetical protein VME43_14595 [Bryobacteraceae bacterium]|nr:hypothetical protein [Bryobacteraceae bacterium]